MVRRAISPVVARVRAISMMVSRQLRANATSLARFHHLV
jgi:hypothetical protein